MQGLTAFKIYVIVVLEQTYPDEVGHPQGVRLAMV